LWPNPITQAERQQHAAAVARLTQGRLTDMYRKELPRVYELRDLIRDPCASNAYFQNFDASLKDEPLKKKVWLARERELDRLDLASWCYLKTEAVPYLTKRDPRGRGWQQLIAILNQTRAHNYLMDAGCSQVRFIPRKSRNGRKTPDLEGELGSRRLLCEVKTVSESDAEIVRRQAVGVGSTTDHLSAGFFNKLTSDLCEARKQIEAHDSSDNVRRIAFIVLNFDDSLAEYKANYVQQIDQHLSENPTSGLEVVFYNQWTEFYVDVSMQHAVVINEAA